MTVRKYDFYSGYEGEPALQVILVVDGVLLSELETWFGHFHRLMEAYSAPAGGWTGLALQCHVGDGFFGDERWTDPDPIGSISIITAARKACPELDSQRLASGLVELYESAVQLGGDVTWVSS